MNVCEFMPICLCKSFFSFLYKTASSLFCILLISEQNKTNKNHNTQHPTLLFCGRGPSCLKAQGQDRRGSCRHEQRARWVRASQGCWGSHRDTIQRAWTSQEPLIYFFHARGILITLQWGDLIRNSSTGLFCSDLIFINAQA